MLYVAFCQHIYVGLARHQRRILMACSRLLSSAPRDAWSSVFDSLCLLVKQVIDAFSLSRSWATRVGRGALRECIVFISHGSVFHEPRPDNLRGDYQYLAAVKMEGDT